MAAFESGERRLDERAFTSQKVSVSEKVSLSLQENRILVLGTEVLVGFQYSAFFHPGFESLSDLQTNLLVGCHGLLLMALALLLAPASFHRLAFGGFDELPVANFANSMAEWALLPFAAVIGTDVYVVVSHAGLAGAAMPLGLGTAALALGLWYGAGWLARRPEEWFLAMDRDRPESREISLKTRIQRLFTETRVVLPGVQALLGFQFAAILTDAFERLPPTDKLIHVGALVAIAIAVVLLMAPAAYHRIVTRGDASIDVLRFGSGAMMLAMLAMSVGLSADLFVVLNKAFESPPRAVGGALAAEVAMLALWFVFPLARRSHTEADARQAGVEPRLGA